MTERSSGRDGEIEALVVDHYLESLLARRPIDTEGVPADLEATARRLAGALPRYHPSFRFEEALAGRLADAAATRRPRDAEVILFPRPGTGMLDLAERSFVGRPVVLGGVLTSAALSLAGAAIVAWRLTRPTESGSRAMRAIIRARAS